MSRSIEYSLAEALCRHPSGLVADAIERYGCCGYDQYGRFQKSSEAVKADALNVVKAFCEEERIAAERDQAGQPSSLEYATCQYGIFEHEDSHPAWSLGWFNDALPPIFDPDYMPESMATAKQEPDPARYGRRDCQMEIILAIAAALKYDPLKIPDGGKARIKAACLTRKMFFTSDCFDHAWKCALAADLVRMENHEKYSPK